MKTRGAVLLIVFFALTARASDCHVYQLTGKIEQEKDSYSLSTGHGTSSEKKFLAGPELTPRLLPYVGLAVQGDFVFGTLSLSQGDRILRIERIEFAVSNPLGVSIPRPLDKKVRCP